MNIRNRVLTEQFVYAILYKCVRTHQQQAEYPLSPYSNRARKCSHFFHIRSVCGVWDGESVDSYAIHFFYAFIIWRVQPLAI